MNYHITWLESAIINFKSDNTVVHNVNGNMTIEEFIEKWRSEICIKLDEKVED